MAKLHEQNVEWEDGQTWPGYVTEKDGGTTMEEAKSDEELQGLIERWHGERDSIYKLYLCGMC